jgi:O-methyltransferase
MTAPGSQLTRDLRKLATGIRWRAEFLLGTPVPAEYPDELRATIKRVRRYTMTSPQRLGALCDGVEYLGRGGIDGAFVECGVWRGGSMMAAALTLLRLGDTERDLYLFDTFSGMPEPSEHDRSSAYDPYPLHERWRRQSRGSEASMWSAVPLEEVRANLLSTGYPAERIHLVAGMVEHTLPAEAPERIAMLRLDTDWYASTKHELEQLYPRLVPGGVLIVDDYGHYEGARKAVDDYFDDLGEALLLNRIDYTGRIAIRTSPTRTPA